MKCKLIILSQPFILQIPSKLVPDVQPSAPSHPVSLINNTECQSVGETAPAAASPLPLSNYLLYRLCFLFSFLPFSFEGGRALLPGLVAFPDSQ